MKLRAVHVLAALACCLAPHGAAPAAQDAQADLDAALAREGIALDREAGVLSMPATVLVKNELLEYLLVSPNGAAHESLFRTTVKPSVLNTALLLLGLEPGRNAYFEETGGVDDRGRPNRRVHPPEGDALYLYAGWTQDGETFFFRVEDLVCNLQSGRSLRRHGWVYLGSRFQKLKLEPDAPEVFLADVEGNLVNLSFFFQGNTLVTAALEECLEQTIWIANAWLLPDEGQSVRLFFARAPLEDPARWKAALPEVDSRAAADEGSDESGDEGR